MNKVFPKDCFVHVCQLGYQLKMITKRVQDKCNCQTFNVLESIYTRSIVLSFKVALYHSK